jgi:hypothetical protein
VVAIDAEHTYINTGSWTFDSSSYAVWDGHSFEVKDWKTGRNYTDRAYRHLRSGLNAQLNFLDWWRTNYLGWFRFRAAEERRLRERHTLAGASEAE